MGWCALPRSSVVCAGWKGRHTHTHTQAHTEWRWRWERCCGASLQTFPPDCLSCRRQRCSRRLGRRGGAALRGHWALPRPCPQVNRCPGWCEGGQGGAGGVNTHYRLAVAHAFLSACSGTRRLTQFLSLSHSTGQRNATGGGGWRREVCFFNLEVAVQVRKPQGGFLKKLEYSAKLDSSSLFFWASWEHSQPTSSILWC